MALRLNRRAVLASLGVAGLAGSVGLGRFGLSRLARPAAPSGPLSDAARALIDQAWKGLSPDRVLDSHVHVVGMGADGTGCWVNPRLTQYLAHPLEALKFSVYRTAGGVDSDAHADREFAAMLLARVGDTPPHGRALLFAFDQVYAEDGAAHPELSEFYTPNAYVLELARAHPAQFVACASVHPYRADAIEALTRAVEGGAVAVKWLPNAMQIDPSSARCDAFYRALVELRVPLITHAGEERAVHADEAQRLGNPLHLRRPLDLGVKVVVAHCASLGQNPDLDAADASGARPWVDNFQLFQRLMSEPRYQGQLFGDLSALTQVNRAGSALEQLLRSATLGHRLINGSDYPLPAINVLVRTGALEARGFLEPSERVALNEIDQHNPLLFDFVLKRRLRWLEAAKPLRFPDDAFMVRPELMPRLKPREG